MAHPYFGDRSRPSQVISTVLLAALCGVVFALICLKALFMWYEGPWGSGWIGLTLMTILLALLVRRVALQTRNLIRYVSRST